MSIGGANPNPLASGAPGDREPPAGTGSLDGPVLPGAVASAPAEAERPAVLA